MIGDGTSAITMRVYAEQDGNLNLELEADGVAPYIMNQTVTQGWNDVVFDVSGADAAVNWNKVQLRPDALGKGGQGNDLQDATTKYYIDDVHFAQATIVPAPNDPTSAEFLAGPDVPVAAPGDVVSLFSNEYASTLDGNNGPDWDAAAVSEMQIDGGNTIKKFDATTWAIFDGLSTDLTGMDTLHISLYMTASSEFEVKLPDLTVGGVEGFYYIPAAALPADQWSTIEIPLSSFSAGGRDTGVALPADHVVSQVDLKPTAGTQTFYMDDLYFSAAPAPVNVAPAFAAASVVIDVDENDTELVYTPQATDSDALTYTLGGPDADKFVINVDGSVSFVTAPDFEAPGSAAGTNSYSFSVTASDGTLRVMSRR